MTEISDVETRIRVFIYTHIAEFGAPPTADAIANEMSMTVHDARAALETLAVNRQVILDPKTREIWMAGPFSAVPTRFRVHGAKASWWANCAWDMFGIPRRSASPRESTRPAPTATPDFSSTSIAMKAQRATRDWFTYFFPPIGGTPTSALREARCSSSGRKIISTDGSSSMTRREALY